MPAARMHFACLVALASASCGPAESGLDLADGLGPAPAPAGAWFTDVTAGLGVEFTLEHGRTGDASYELPEVMGGGLALFDCDGDGDLDLFFVNGGPRGAHRLFVNEGARFRDATAQSGIAPSGFGMGVAVGDLDRDGDLDLYLTHRGPDRLYRNDGSGHFTDATAALGLASDGWSSSAAFFDRDGDGWLDLFVARYVRFEPELQCPGFFGRPDWCGPRSFEPEHDLLFANLGGQGFVEVTGEVGLATAPAPGLGVVCADFDGDGRTDVFVANDAAPNQLWVDGGAGRLRDAAPELGLALNGDGAAEAGMGVLLAPLTRPAQLELLLTHLRGESNTLYRRAPEQLCFEDASRASGLAAPSLPFTGFGVAALDLELDGDLDLVVANGGVNRGEPNPYSSLPPPWGELAEPDHLFLNRAGQFEPAPERGGPLCRTVRISRGLVSGDLDGDGDQDLVLSSLLEPARVLRNDAPRSGHHLRVRVLERPAPARAEALGAEVRIATALGEQVRVVGSSAGYLSSGPALLHFGLGAAERYERIRVTWADGEISRFDGGPADRLVTLERSAP